MNKNECLSAIQEMFSFLNVLYNVKYTLMDSNHSTDIYYLSKEYGIQIEIVWREFDIFIYFVKLENGVIPSDEYYYIDMNGDKCRKYIEDIIGYRNSIYKSMRKSRYTWEFLLEKSLRYPEKLKIERQILSMYLEQSS